MMEFLKDKYVKRLFENTVFINQTPPSMRRTKSHVRTNIRTRKQLFSENTPSNNNNVPSSKFHQENFADFSVFNDSVLSRTRSDSTGHNNSGSSLDSRNNSSSTENKSFDDLECISNAMPQPQSKYESIAKLDMEEKMKRTKSSPADPVHNQHKQNQNFNNHHTQQQFYLQHQKQQQHLHQQNLQHQLLKQRTKSLDASVATEVFLKYQFGSPTSTGHALFGVLPQNSPIRAQLQQALRLQQQQENSSNIQNYNPNNPFLTSSTQGSASTKS